MSGNKIEAIDCLTVDTTNLVHGLKKNVPMSLAIDPVEQKLYFKNGASITKSRLDGTNAEVFLKKADPDYMTIDWIRRRIFWTQWKRRTILVANLNGKDKRVLKITKYQPYSIIVDPIGG